MRTIYSTLNAVTFTHTASRKTRTLPNSRSRSTFVSSFFLACLLLTSTPASTLAAFASIPRRYFFLCFATVPACAFSSLPMSCLVSPGCTRRFRRQTLEQNPLSRVTVPTNAYYRNNRSASHCTSVRRPSFLPTKAQPFLNIAEPSRASSFYFELTLTGFRAGEFMRGCTQIYIRVMPSQSGSKIIYLCVFVSKLAFGSRNL